MPNDPVPARSLLKATGRVLVSLIAIAIGGQPTYAAQQSSAEAAWRLARQRGAIYGDCGRNAARLLQGWLDQKQDPETHLYSRGRTWDYHNEAADHYSSLVLMAFYVRPELAQPGGPLHQTLLSSQKLCATPSGLPTTYDLRSGTRGKTASFGQLSEWLRDGLIRITEVMGTDNDWYREMERLVDAMLAEAEKRGGTAKAISGHETTGNMLQTLARLYAMSGKERYLRAAEALADDSAVLHGRVSTNRVRFIDHGCELVPGLAELFALESQLKRPKAAQYREPLRQLLDGILAASAHPQTGLFCTSKVAAKGQREWQRPPDTWGYVLFAYENYDRATGENRYRAAIEKPMRWLVGSHARYSALKQTLWPNSRSSDDWSDSFESMIVLWNRFPQIQGAFGWLDWATSRHVHRRHGTKRYGPFTGGHFDGSTGRTLCLHMMLCSQGVRTVPSAEGLCLGAVQRDGALLLSLESRGDWRGRLCFAPPRDEHRAATIDWARINEMPQWFVVRPEAKYVVTIDGGPPAVLSGRELIRGVEMSSGPGQLRQIRVTPAETAAHAPSGLTRRR